MSDRESILVRWMGVTDANALGRVHGGAVMRLCDEAAALAAIRHAHHRVVTAAVDRLTFLSPVYLGEVLTLRASVNAAWHSSMEVGVRVEAENPVTGEVRHTSSAYLTMVAIDEQGHPVAVPPLVAGSRSAQGREREAQRRRANRLTEREQTIAERSRDGAAGARQSSSPCSEA